MCPGRVAAPIARTTMPTANKRTGHACASCWVTSASNILNWWPPLNELYSQEWSQYQNHFRPTFKLLKREKQGSKTIKTYENQPKTPYQRLLESPDLPEALKNQMRTQHVGLDPFALKKGIEKKLTNFFTLLGKLNRESTKT